MGTFPKATSIYCGMNFEAVLLHFVTVHIAQVLRQLWALFSRENWAIIYGMDFEEVAQKSRQPAGLFFWLR